jgi:hypothetical protein
MNKWLHKFMEKPDISDKPDNTDKWDGNLENIPGEGPDKPDRLDPNLNLSGLSGRPQGLLDKKKVENNLRKGGDKSDRFRFEPNMSPLSLRSQGLFPLDRDSFLDEYEERLAIAEYDGGQVATQAQRIALSTHQFI